MGRASKATIRAEVSDKKALSFKPVIEMGEEGRKMSFLYRLQPGYFKSICTVCHQRVEEGKECSFCEHANANMARDIEARRRNAEMRKARKQAEKQRANASNSASAQDVSRNNAMDMLMNGRKRRSDETASARDAKKLGKRFTEDGRRICDFFKDGNCRNGDKCAFAHVFTFIPPGETGNDLT